MGGGVFSEDGRGRAVTGPIPQDRLIIAEFGMLPLRGAHPGEEINMLLNCQVKP